MFTSKTIVSAVLAAIAGKTTATLNINNWCGQDVQYWQSTGAGCDAGPNGICYDQPGAYPWTISPGNIDYVPWVQDPQGTSIKIALGDNTWLSGVLQFEYTLADNLYWDLSDLDGAGSGVVGSPFLNQNVKVSPTGNGAEQNSCIQIRCPAGTLCAGAYNDPNQMATNVSLLF